MWDEKGGSKFLLQKLGGSRWWLDSGTFVNIKWDGNRKDQFQFNVLLSVKR